MSTTQDNSTFLKTFLQKKPINNAIKRINNWPTLLALMGVCCVVFIIGLERMTHASGQDKVEEVTVPSEELAANETHPLSSPQQAGMINAPEAFMPMEASPPPPQEKLDFSMANAPPLPDTSMNFAMPEPVYETSSPYSPPSPPPSPPVKTNNKASERAQQAAMAPTSVTMAANGTGTKNWATGETIDTKKAGFNPNNPSYQITSGTVIPAVMISGIHNKAPGHIIGQVSQHVYDTATGSHLLIPQGTKLFGSYDQRVAVGRDRLNVIWTRLTLPNGKTIEINRLAGTDGGGYSGFNDKTSRRYGAGVGRALLLSAFSVGSRVAGQQTGSANVGDIAANTVGTEVGRQGERSVQQDIDFTPTLQIRPGYRFNVMVSEDLDLMPWRG